MIKVNDYKRIGKKGTALYLDYRLNGERMQEATGLVLLNGNDTRTKHYNKETMIRLEHLKFEKQKQLMDGIITPLSVKRQRIDFIKYMEEYMVLNPSRERRNTSTLNKLKQFWLNETGKTILPITEITENMLKKFKNFLESTLTGETPYDYFKAFKRVLKQATKEGLFTRNPADDVIVSIGSNEPKAILFESEITSLQAARCINEAVRRAAIFSFYTGLRFCDIKELKWKHIINDRLKIIQVKTRVPLDQFLIQKALDLLGKRGEDEQYIFPLPTSNGTNKILKQWGLDAGIDKKITYHCFRHSFASFIFERKRDILTTSKALGHRSIKFTQTYIRVAQTTVDDALECFN